MSLAVPVTGLYAAIQAIIVTILLFPIGRMRRDKIATPQRIAGAAITRLVTIVAAVALLVRTLPAL